MYPSQQNRYTFQGRNAVVATSGKPGNEIGVPDSDEAGEYSVTHNNGGGILHELGKLDKILEGDPRTPFEPPAFVSAICSTLIGSL